MRKYRGLTKEGKWVYGWYCFFQFWGKHIIMVDNPPNLEDFEVIPETVGQSIDFRDKNNVEIYEQDVLDSYWVVRFYDGHYVLCNPIDEPAKQCAKEMLDRLVAEESIITGNIHNVA